jgi:opacity protein-like surface antigen
MIRIKSLLLSAAGILLMASSSFASSIYLNQSDFTAALTSGYDFENFESMDFQAAAHSWSFSQNGFDWTASTTDYFGSEPADNPAAILFIDSGPSVAMIPAGGNTSGAGDALTLTFTSGNVTAIGGNFFLTDFLGSVRGGSFSLTMNDGTTQSFTDAGADNFFGYISSSPITSLTFTPPGPFTSWATIDNLYVGQAAAVSQTPETSTMGLLLGGLSLLGALKFLRSSRFNASRGLARR